MSAAPLCTDCRERPAYSVRPRTASGARCDRCAVYFRRYGRVRDPAAVAWQTPRVAVLDPAQVLTRRRACARRVNARDTERQWVPAVTRMARALAASHRAQLPGLGLAADDCVQAGLVAYWRARARPGVGMGHRLHAHRRAMTAARAAVADLLARPNGETRAAARAGYGLALVPLDVLRDAAAPAQAAPAHGWADGRALARLPRNVRRAVGRLPATQQQVLRLTLQGRGPLEIGRIIGANKNTAALRKHHAFAALRARFAPAVPVVPSSSSP